MAAETRVGGRSGNMLDTPSLSRWGRVVAAIYVGLAVIAGALAVQRLAVSTECQD